MKTAATPICITALDEAGSTNSVIRNMAAAGAPHGTVVAVRSQTAGRGQRGNTWESEPGKNLTFSILLRPCGIEARRQFMLSEAVAVAVAESVQSWLPDDAPTVEVKWPNDIYIANRKICGILIENSLSGASIGFSIVGVGININQKKFLSDAPNPVSVIHYTKAELTLCSLLEDVSRRIVERCDTLPDDAYSVHADFLARLWRRNGEHLFREPGGELFYASIADVRPDGTLILRHADSQELHGYAFKEIEAVLG